MLEEIIWRESDISVDVVDVTDSFCVKFGIGDAVRRGIRGDGIAFLLTGTGELPLVGTGEYERSNTEGALSISDHL